MDLLLLRSFVAVAETGTISDAAGRIGISQPALSRRISQLEEEFGAELFDRSRRGVVATSLGRTVLREARTLIERYDNLKATVEAELRLETGSIWIGAGATAVSAILPRAIARFSRQRPGVRFKLWEAGSRQVEAAVLAERLDLGVVTLPVSSGELSVSPLTRDRIVLVASPGHPLSELSRIPPRRLDGQNVVGFEQGTALRELIDARLRAMGVRVNVVMELRSIATMLEFAKTIGSLAFVSELGVRGSWQRWVRPVPELRLERELAIISKHERPLSPAASEFAKDLLAHSSTLNVQRSRGS